MNKYKPDRNIEKMGISEKERFSRPYPEQLDGMHGITLSPSYFQGLSRNQKALAVAGALIVLGAVCMAGCTTTPAENTVSQSVPVYDFANPPSTSEYPQTYILRNCEDRAIMYVFDRYVGEGLRGMVLDTRPEIVEKYCGCANNSSGY